MSRILDFSDGFESNVLPTVTGILASDITVTPTGTIAATTVQTALAELDTEKIAKVVSVDNTVPRFDGIAGAVQTSGVVISDTNNVTGVVALTASGTVSANLIAGAAVKDEDDMASNSATHLASQQSIKAYVDSKLSGLPTVQRFLSGSGTYTTPANVQYLRVRMVGAGGGGASGQGSAGLNNGANGSAVTTFGTSLLAAAAGLGGSYSGGDGGGPSISAPAVGIISLTGGSGTSGGYTGGSGSTITIMAQGGVGGSTAFGGAGGGATSDSSGSSITGKTATANSGAGGGGGGTTSNNSSYGGGGGGAGGYVEAVIGTPGATYAYAVGTGGAGGAATAGCGAGGAGANGIIIVEEYY